VDVQFSTIHDVGTSQLFGRVHDSEYFNVSFPATNASFDPNYHTNVTYLAQWNGAAEPESEPAFVYNNVLHDFAAGSGGFYAQTCDNMNAATYIYNNVVYNNFAGGNANVQIDPDGGSLGCGNYFVYNNTLQMPTSDAIVRVVGRGFAVANVTTVNNHYISDSGNVFSAPNGVTSHADSNNVLQTNAVANGQGYVPANLYAPTASMDATVGAGTNLSGSCSALPLLCLDRTGAARPSTGNWDVGAYEFH
jgi:hypothetical protein